MILSRDLIDPRNIAAWLWPRFSETFDAVNYNARFQTWLAEHNFRTFRHRQFMHHEIQKTMIGEQPITYLEFGVWEGKSLAMWAGLNKHPASHFLGFDSFKGLPEDSQTWGDAGLFKIDSPPSFSDARISLVPGYFHETLPNFVDLHEMNRRLVVHIDCDLYSSTLYVLTMLDRIMVPGTILLFDEMVIADHEFRAFLDWSASYRRQCKVIGGFERNGRIEGVALVIEESTDD